MAQAAGGYVSYGATSGKYILPPEQALALANEDSPAFMIGGFQGTTVYINDEPKIVHAFRTGKGVDWGEHDPMLYEATERFFKPNYVINIASSWISSLDGGRVAEKSKKGGPRVADVGCGHGTSTFIMAKAYPNSTFIGFDNHVPSIEYAPKKAREDGLAQDRITFEIASATDFPKDNEYDLITFFGCLHDMGDPRCRFSCISDTKETRWCLDDS